MTKILTMTANHHTMQWPAAMVCSFVIQLLQLPLHGSHGMEKMVFEMEILKQESGQMFTVCCQGSATEQQMSWHKMTSFAASVALQRQSVPSVLRHTYTQVLLNQALPLESGWQQANLANPAPWLYPLWFCDWKKSALFTVCFSMQ